MSEIEKIQKGITLARCELKNIRQEVMKLKAKQKKETEDIVSHLSKLQLPCFEDKRQNLKDQNANFFNMVPIGFISSCFKNKNGIPRQSTLCEASKACLEINKTYFTNPEHSLIGLTEFSFIWILFVFHKNKENSIKAKVHPPRMSGISVGVFSTRSPHRPCAIGLSLTKIEKIRGNIIFLSGVDMLDGTPVLDIKPYIPSYDIPKFCGNSEIISETDFSLKEVADALISENSKSKDVPDMQLKNRECKKKEVDKLQNDPSQFSISAMLKKPENYLDVLFTERATKDIERFHSLNPNSTCEYCLNFINGCTEAKQAIVEILRNDPRSVYRKSKCSDKLYFFEVDNMHVTCWFDDIIAEVLRVKPISKCNTV